MPANDSPPPTVRFHYIKSNYYRVIHMDGAYGGFTPQGHIFLSVYNERSPLPDALVHEVEETGRLGKEIVEQRKIPEGIERELEVGIAMDLKTAKSLLRWLRERVQLAEKFQRDVQPETSEIKQ